MIQNSIISIVNDCFANICLGFAFHDDDDDFSCILLYQESVSLLYEFIETHTLLVKHTVT